MTDTPRPRGRFIAIEGGEGAGKSTQTQRLAEHLGGVATREPGGSALGEQLRSLLLESDAGSIHARAELMLMLAARAQHVAELIRPALDAGQAVVVDRYSGSTLAYQGFGRGLSVGGIEAACDLATGGLWPDLTILLDVSLEIGAARRAGSRRDRIEGEDDDFFAKVRSGFLEIAQRHTDSWAVIDASGSPDEVTAAIFKVVGR